VQISCKPPIICSLMLSFFCFFTHHFSFHPTKSYEEELRQNLQPLRTGVLGVSVTNARNVLLEAVLTKDPIKHKLPVDKVPKRVCLLSSRIILSKPHGIFASTPISHFSDEEIARAPLNLI